MGKNMRRDTVHFEVDDEDSGLKNVLACGSIGGFGTRFVQAVECTACQSTLAYKEVIKIVEKGPTKKYVEDQHEGREKLPVKVVVNYYTSQAEEGEDIPVSKIDMPIIPLIMVSDGLHADVFDSTFVGMRDMPLIRRESYIARLRALATILEEG